MLKTGVCAIAQVVMSGREQLVLLRPHGKLLVMTGLHFPQRVRKGAEFEAEVADIAFKPEEEALTNTLIGASRVANFSIDAYSDQYVTKLRKLIDLKVAGQEIVQAPDHEEPKILNLMDALKKSVAEAQARAAGALPPAGHEEPVAEAAPAEKKLAPSAGRKKGPRKVEGE